MGAAIAHARYLERSDSPPPVSTVASRLAPPPRERGVPVTVDFNVAVKTTDGSRPPQLRKVYLAVNRYGQIPPRPAGLQPEIASSDRSIGGGTRPLP